MKAERKHVKRWMRKSKIFNLVEAKIHEYDFYNVNTFLFKN